MFIDATRYRAFWSSPEAYRLRYIWNLTPTMPEIGMERLLLRGRQRGSAFHDLMDALGRGGIFKVTANAQTINATLRELVGDAEELPQDLASVVEVYQRPKCNMRKATAK